MQALMKFDPMQALTFSGLFGHLFQALVFFSLTCII